jgi:hypothetical protein
MKNKGEILVENVIFIILNLIFLSILVIFIIKQSSGAVMLEDSYSKQIALLIDSAKPQNSEVVIQLDMSDGSKIDKKWFAQNFNRVLSVDGNVVNVKLSEKGGSSYSFFNDVAVSTEVGPTGQALIIIRGKNG